MSLSDRKLPDCWGHRGASASYPENTLASFEAAMRDGAEGIESDVHVSADDVVVMFHDPALNRTTDSTGNIKERNWYGEDGMEHVRTVKEPKQAIPTFAETPENQHVKFNVDVKVQNDPERLFKLMHEVISAQPAWETALAPRILLGLWHPAFLAPAKRWLSYCRRAHIGCSVAIARRWFWEDCEAFSMAFQSLATLDGARFRKECKAAGKKVMVWTVNEPIEMMEAARWEVDAILTDVTKTWLNLRADLKADYDKTGSRFGRTFLWTRWGYYSPAVNARGRLVQYNLESIAGPFNSAVVLDVKPEAAVGLERKSITVQAAA
ncbi:hypothetical protein D9619_000550 [Psilocybe cf. subviscida]|uniref:GP-PDE domain-containing protein n=1 Tax=Psilocybe cf. subviscida TaxID=2480587 RepID=A0A8H5BDD1_9AGAR|nr:hypothetical protein D9619_000550 [Psilocybe cf. subviscida]